MTFEGRELAAVQSVRGDASFVGKTLFIGQATPPILIFHVSTIPFSVFIRPLSHSWIEFLSPADTCSWTHSPMERSHRLEQREHV
jgi:hypothetical protein